MRRKQKDREGDSSKRHTSGDFEFCHHLHDTIILLGGSRRIADLLTKSKDASITDDDIDILRTYNLLLSDQIKERLAGVHTLKVRPKGG